jgi:MbtH protein
MSDTYQVVHNDDGQYSIWTTEEDPPAGWYPDGTTGTREECLDHIERGAHG